ncbi:MAG: hypothetical protein KVP17_000205 [Porospora cf. gigantea B]|uniref:uncharacterized protein n=1 Tax=Porospora cf. gigantea B TaxID=2853592 RepID=UPI003571DFEE|nr:MAG: hypothetical protein KVP17_000205 [Porospora cf. gigantea B]
MTGRLVVVEGTDRCGKSTQCSLLLEWLKELGKQAVLLKFPDRQTSVGSIIDEFLSKKEEVDPHAIHLLFSANRWEKANQIKELLEKGVWVVCDRWTYSGVAYSTAAWDLDWEWCLRPDEGLPVPDLVLQIRVEPEMASKRSGYGNELYEKIVLQAKILEAFERFADHISQWHLIDGSSAVQAVFQQIKDRVFQLV